MTVARVPSIPPQIAGKIRGRGDDIKKPIA
jgi:hypothetical protein